MKDRPTVAGFDLSLTSTGYSVLQGDKILERGTVGGTYKDFRRLILITDGVQRLCNEHKPKMVCLEGYSFASRHKLADLGELGGLTKYFLYQLRVPFTIVSPNQLKKFITGKGTGKKNVVILHTFKQYGVEFDNDDECDAYVLARIAQAILNADLSSLNKTQQEVIKKLKGR